MVLDVQARLLGRDRLPSRGAEEHFRQLFDQVDRIVKIFQANQQLN